MISKDALLQRQYRPPVAVTVPVVGEVLLRYPTYAEWHSIIAAHKNVTGAPPPEVVARTVALVLAEPDGSKMLTEAEARQMTDNDCDMVAAIYRAAIDTVLNVGKQVDDAEKN